MVKRADNDEEGEEGDADNYESSDEEESEEEYSEEEVPKFAGVAPTKKV
jgi:hypothetical protein